MRGPSDRICTPCISRYRSQGRDSGRSLRRGSRRQNHRGQTDHSAGQKPRDTHAEHLHSREVRRAHCPKHSTEPPHDNYTYPQAQWDGCPAPVQRLSAHKPPYLPLIRAQTSHHPEKPDSACHAAVHTSGDHQDSRCRNQHCQNCCHSIKLCHISVAALELKRQQLSIEPCQRRIDVKLCAYIIYSLLHIAKHPEPD